MNPPDCAQYFVRFIMHNARRKGVCNYRVLLQTTSRARLKDELFASLLV